MRTNVKVSLKILIPYFFTLSAPKQLAFIHAYPHWLAVSTIFLTVFALMHLPFAWQRVR